MSEFSNYISKGWTRHEAFSEVLRTHPPRGAYRRGDIIVLLVNFGRSDHVYCYLSKDDVYKPGDLVEVSVRGENKVVTVASVGYYAPEDYPFRELRLNTINGPASGNLAEKYRRAIEEEEENEADAEAIRSEAKKELEEARAIRLEAEEEREKADRERREAAGRLEEAARILQEAQRARDEARNLADRTVTAGEEARRENQRLEEAKIEAAKVWKRERPATEDVTVLRLREVQDALDEDEQIYRRLSELETKIVKVQERARVLQQEDAGITLRTEIDRIYDFYLPTTVRLLEQFRNIFSSGLPPASVGKLRQDVLETIARSNEVYENVLEGLYQDDLLELQSELSALRTMFAINGLTDSDFERGNDD